MDVQSDSRSADLVAVIADEFRARLCGYNVVYNVVNSHTFDSSISRLFAAAGLYNGTATSHYTLCTEME